MSYVYVCESPANTEGYWDRTTFCPFEDGEILAQEWTTSIIFLSWIYAIMGSIACVEFMQATKRQRDNRLYWTFVSLAGVSLGGCCVWTMHFVGMKALKIGNRDVMVDLPHGERKIFRGVLRVDFDLVLTAVSFIAACSLTALAFWHITRRDLKAEAANWEARESRIRQCTVGVAVAVGIMNYMGMWAQVGHFDMHWDGTVILGSVVLALVVVYVGLQIVFWKRIVPTKLNLTMAGLIIGSAVCSVHYSGMHAAEYKFKADGYRSTGLGLPQTSFGDAYTVVIVISCIKFTISAYREEVEVHNMSIARKLFDQELAGLWLKSDSKGLQKLKDNGQPFDNQGNLDFYNVLNAFEKQLHLDGVREPRFLYPASGPTSNAAEKKGTNPMGVGDTRDV